MYMYSNSNHCGYNITMSHAFVGKSQIFRPEVLWTTQCTVARERQPEDDSPSGRPQQHRGAIGLTLTRGRPEIDVLLPNKCKHM